MNEADIETMKLVDELRQLQSMMEARSKGYDGMQSVMEIDGKNYDPEDIAAAMMLLDLKKLKELVDVRIPIYADLIDKIEGLPYIVEAMKSCEEFEATV